MISLKNIIKALSASVIGVAVLVFVFSLILIRTVDPVAHVGACSIAILLLSAFFGGAFTRRGDAGLLNTLIFSGVFVLVYLALCLSLGSPDTVMLLVSCLGCPVAAFLGSAVFSHTAGKKPKGLRRYRKSRKIKK